VIGIKKTSAIKSKCHTFTGCSREWPKLCHMSITHSPVSKELKQLAMILADWAALAPAATIYLYGSRVRGDHRPDSDVDIYISWGKPDDPDLEWWTKNNEQDFADINAKLPGRLQILEDNDPLNFKIRAAAVVYEDRQVKCVHLPPKTISRP
jgi:predicted nucleotidyltransferase